MVTIEIYCQIIYNFNFLFQYRWLEKFRNTHIYLSYVLFDGYKLIMAIFCDADNFDDELIYRLNFEYNHSSKYLTIYYIFNTILL